MRGVGRVVVLGGVMVVSAVKSLMDGLLDLKKITSSRLCMPFLFKRLIKEVVVGSSPSTARRNSDRLVRGGNLGGGR